MSAARRRFASSLTLALCLGAVMLPSRARSETHTTPDQRKQAQHLVEEGAALHKKSDDAGALAKFQQAYALFPTPKLLFNIALMLSDLGNNADAADALQRFIDAAANDPKLSESDFPANARKRLAQLEPTVGRVDLSVTPPDAAISVDSRAARAGIVYLSAGTHQVIASASGFDSSTQLVAIAAGQRQTLVIALHATAPVPNLAPTPRSPPPPMVTAVEPAPAASSSIGLAPKVLWATGGVLAAGAAVMSGVAFGEYQSLHPQAGPSPSNLPAPYATELRNARLADGLWAGAIVAAGIGTGLWLFATPAGGGGNLSVGGHF